MKNRNTRNRNNRRNNRSNQPAFKPRAEKVTEISYRSGITVGELAHKLNRSSSDIIKVLFMLGNMVTINDVLSDDFVELICMEYNVTATKEEIIDVSSLDDIIVDDPKDLEERAPIVTIMGHVDHGKTTLLDSIRSAKVTADEFGGITQHIGAYQVKVKGKKVTFLDTPGHEAFTSMRARGAQVTDIVVIVVAADDGVMPQTREAIDHAKAANVPMIVAINKMDKPTANPEFVKTELMNLGVVAEEYGGDTAFVEVSALKKTGIDDLLENILVLSELLELKANPNRIALGTVIEARLDKGRGPVATLLVQTGTLETGQSLVVGAVHGRVRKMVDDLGREIKKAGPSTPVEIIGLSDVPEAGDLFKVFKEEKQARSVADSRMQEKIESERKKSSAVSLDELSKRLAEGEITEIPIVLKADVQGSAEAVKDALERIEVGQFKVNVIRSTVGAITESDIMLATASNAIIYGFNVRPSALIRNKAKEEGVDIRLHNIIYKAVEEMEAAMNGMLDPVFEEVILGQAEVRQLFKVSKIGTIAGCMVTDGKMVKDSKVRLIRDGVVVYDGQLGSLKRFNNDVKEVKSGFDCGLTIKNFNDIKENDIVEAYGDQEVTD
ncbi:MAG: translation initiation factor IF-2 [Erysipelothrix sp.]|nr:translation initiation factor IF-2 [Erysipelothrix sp.]